VSKLVLNFSPKVRIGQGEIGRSWPDASFAGVLRDCSSVRSRCPEARPILDTIKASSGAKSSRLAGECTGTARLEFEEGKRYAVSEFV